MTPSDAQRTPNKFIKLARFEESEDLKTLIKSHHNEFILLTVVALRARRELEDSKLTNLKQYQAFIGDHNAYGMSRQNYRTAKSNLQKWGYITCESTNKGTTATLTDLSIYDINPILPNHQTNRQLTAEVTNAQPTPNHKEECKNVKNERMEELPLGDKPKKEKFIPPCIEEVRELIKSYCMDRKLNIEIMQVGMMAEDFHDHYENTGWKLSAGKGALMKRWDLALKKWVRNAFKNGELDRTAK